MTEHLRVFQALTQTGETKPVRSIPTTPPIGSPRICHLVPLFRAELPSFVSRPSSRRNVCFVGKRRNDRTLARDHGSFRNRDHDARKVHSDDGRRRHPPCGRQGRVSLLHQEFAQISAPYRQSSRRSQASRRVCSLNRPRGHPPWPARHFPFRFYPVMCSRTRSASFPIWAVSSSREANFRSGRMNSRNSSRICFP